MSRCQFGLCLREADFAVTIRGDVDAVLVCGLHVGPLLSWGVPDPHATEPSIIYVPSRPAAS